jgi:hypothetical protein
MISARKRPLILGAMLLPGTLAPRLAASAARQATPATPSPPSPPTQPASGPGGADYVYDTVVTTASGKAPGEYWLFEPTGPHADAPPADEPLSLVIFIGPSFASKPIGPEMYLSWIEHLVRRGAVVIYPLYIPTAGMSRFVEDAVVAALADLGSEGHAPVDLSRVAAVGDGNGGDLCLHLVAAPPPGLAPPFALMAAHPEGATVLDEVDVAAMPAVTHVVLVGSEHASDLFRPRPALEQIWADLARSSRIPPEQRAYVVLRSDDHGAPALIADETLTLANTDSSFGGEGGTRVDALDWYGTWKLLDALMGCAFAGEWCAYAFGDTPEVRFMGTWSDGVPVNEAIVVGKLATPVAAMAVSDPT